MPSIPLINELGANAPKFATLIDRYATPTATDLRGVTRFTDEDTAQLMSTADTRIFVRVRPVLAHEMGGNNNSVPVVRALRGVADALFVAPKITLAGACSIEPTPVKVHRTFGAEDTTAAVYAAAGQQLLRMAVDGASSTIIAYGQTGSGKTFTTTGLLEQMARDIGDAATRGPVTVGVIAVEIKAERCVDLLTNTEVNVCEDTKGEMQILGATEMPVSSAREVLDVCQVAIRARATKATERNAGSSRSHMVIRFIMRRKDASWARPGLLVLADLAGSESTADSAKHDKERVSETKFINSSLMTLKDCIRSRTQSGTSTKHVHIPYRQSKLTLLLRDSFELAVKRPTKTVVIATVSPLLQDVRHTSGTLRYASLLVVQPPATVLAEDPEDPCTWTRAAALDFLVASSRNMLKCPEAILVEGDGRALVQIPEAEFIRRAAVNAGMPEKSAKMLYSLVWKKIVDARTRSRRAVLKVKPENKLVRAEKDEDFRRELVRRVVAGH